MPKGLEGTKKDRDPDPEELKRRIIGFIDTRLDLMRQYVSENRQENRRVNPERVNKQTEAIAFQTCVVLGLAPSEKVLESLREIVANQWEEGPLHRATLRPKNPRTLELLDALTSK